jgi:microcystin degradation protein MlrC
MTGRDSKFAIAGLWQETNTYAPKPTTLENFENFELAAGSDVGALHKNVRSVIGGAIDSLGESACFGLSTGAWPSGVITSTTAEKLLDLFETKLQNLAPVRGLLLNLHGAMVAEGVADIEFAAVQLAKQVLGDVPIVAVLDLHANPSTLLLESLSGVVAYRTFPHVDMYERGFEAGRMLQRIAENNSASKVVFRKLPLITSPLVQGTSNDPMRQIITATDKVGHRSRSFITPGFAYSDVSRAGLSIMVNSDDDTRSESLEALESLTSTVQRESARFHNPAVSVNVARDRLKSQTGKTMLVDVGDNIGGGSPGSSTALLPILLGVPDRRSIFTFSNSALVRDAGDLGVGSWVPIQFGVSKGVVDSADFQVVALTSGQYRAGGEWMGGRVFEMGPTVILRHRSVHVMVTSVPVPPFHRQQLVSQGLDPLSFDVLTAKGALAWQDAYGDCVDSVIYVDTPGPTPAFPEDLFRRQSTDENAESWKFPERRREIDERHVEM